MVTFEDYSDGAIQRGQKYLNKWHNNISLLWKHKKFILPPKERADEFGLKKKKKNVLSRPDTYLI